MSPTARTLAGLRKAGYVAEVVEQFVAGKFRRDYLGCIDILAFRPGRTGVVGIQATTTDNMAHRVVKAMEEERLKAFLSCPDKQFVIVGWAKRGPRGGRKLWTAKAVELVRPAGAWSQRPADWPAEAGPLRVALRVLSRFALEEGEFWDGFWHGRRSESGVGALRPQRHVFRSDVEYIALLLFSTWVGEEGATPEELSRYVRAVREVEMRFPLGFPA